MYLPVILLNSVNEAGSMLHRVNNQMKTCETLIRSLLSHMVKVLKVIYWSRNGVLFSELLEVSVHACRLRSVPPMHSTYSTVSALE